MKRIFFLFLLQLTTLFAFGQTSQRYVNTRDGLSLRENPSLDSNILTTIPYDGMIVLIGEYGNVVIIEDIQNKWEKVFYENTIGWVFGGFLSDRNSQGRNTGITRGIYNNIKREFMLENELPDIPQMAYVPRITIDSSSNVKETPRGFKIGDSIEELLRKYPCAIKCDPRRSPFYIDTNYYYWSISYFVSGGHLLAAISMCFYYNGDIIYKITLEYSEVDTSARSP
jgi:hypothetical protein